MGAEAVDDPEECEGVECDEDLISDESDEDAPPCGEVADGVVKEVEWPEEDEGDEGA